MKDPAVTAMEIEVRLVREFTDAARDAARRFPNDYDAALRYAQLLVSEEGAW